MCPPPRGRGGRRQDRGTARVSLTGYVPGGWGVWRVVSRGGGARGGGWGRGAGGAGRGAVEGGRGPGSVLVAPRGVPRRTRPSTGARTGGDWHGGAPGRPAPAPPRPQKPW